MLQEVIDMISSSTQEETRGDDSVHEETRGDDWFDWLVYIFKHV